MEEVVDLALKKPVLEFCNHPEQLTAEGDELEYDATKGGYLGIHHPAFITVDMETEVKVKQISMKLYDSAETLNKTKVPEKQAGNYSSRYAFRLLCSTDMESWKVLYDTTKAIEPYGDKAAGNRKPYRKGWQWAVFDEPVRMRYFRIHALHNPANSGFHVVRLRLYNKEYDKMKLGEKMTLQTGNEMEIKDALPLSARLLNLSQRLDVATPDTIKKGNDREYLSLKNQIVERSIEVHTVDGKVDQFRRIITPHMVKFLEDHYINERKTNLISWTVTLSLIFIKSVFEVFEIHNTFATNAFLWTVGVAALMVTLFNSWPWFRYALEKLIPKVKNTEETVQTPDENVIVNNVRAIDSEGNSFEAGNESPEGNSLGALFSDEIGRYDISTGFHAVTNPGWIEVSLKKPEEISYLRFLLWDNCGSEKKQPSNRRYVYRLLISESDDPANRSWEAAYDNHISPSNGWQEFYFEDRTRKITAIKLQFFHTLSLSTNPTTQIVSIQAFKNPTENFFESGSPDTPTSYAPPVSGIVRSRVILGPLQEQMGFIVESEITDKIKDYLTRISSSSNLEDRDILHIESFKDDIEKNKESGLNKQLNLLYKSILSPVNRYNNKLELSALWVSTISNIMLSIDILPLSNYITLISMLLLIITIGGLGLYLDNKRGDRAGAVSR